MTSFYFFLSNSCSSSLLLLTFTYLKLFFIYGTNSALWIGVLLSNTEGLMRLCLILGTGFSRVYSELSIYYCCCFCGEKTRRRMGEAASVNIILVQDDCLIFFRLSLFVLLLNMLMLGLEADETFKSYYFKRFERPRGNCFD